MLLWLTWMKSNALTDDGAIGELDIYDATANEDGYLYSSD